MRNIDKVNSFPDGRTLRRKYPWDDLKKEGDYFFWDDISDAKSIRSAAIGRGLKITCLCNGEKLLVKRLKT